VEKLHDINEVKFQGVSSLFLKELAKSINNSLMSNDEHKFTAKSFDYPTCLLNNKVVKYIKDVLKNMSEHTFIAVFNDFLEAMPKDMLKGIVLYMFHFSFRVLKVLFFCLILNLS
jgi:hypothetical protein